MGVDDGCWVIRPVCRVHWGFLGDTRDMWHFRFGVSHDPIICPLDRRCILDIFVRGESMPIMMSICFIHAGPNQRTR